MTNLELPVIDPMCAYDMDLYWAGVNPHRIVKRQPDTDGDPWYIEQVTFDEVAMDAARGRCDDN
jgi:hypothetical protein